VAIHRQLILNCRRSHLAIFAMWYITDKDQILHIPKLIPTVQYEMPINTSMLVSVTTNTGRRIATGRSHNFNTLVKGVRW
jgi:hypothetical protein